MSNILEENHLSRTERIAEQYHILKDDIEKNLDTKDVEARIFYKSLEYRLSSLFSTLEKITDSHMNSTLRGALSGGLEEDLEIIRRTLIKIDIEGLEKAKLFFDKSISKKST